jgi:hypothetical protein
MTNNFKINKDSPNKLLSLSLLKKREKRAKPRRVRFSKSLGLSQLRAMISPQLPFGHLPLSWFKRGVSRLYVMFKTKASCFPLFSKEREKEHQRKKGEITTAAYADNSLLTTNYPQLPASLLPPFIFIRIASLIH